MAEVLDFDWCVDAQAQPKHALIAICLPDGQLDFLPRPGTCADAGYRKGLVTGKAE
jgi:hypothetical protein